MRKQIINIVGILLLISFVILCVYSIQTQRNQIQIKKIELKSTESKLIELNSKYDEVLEQKTSTDNEKKEQLKKIEELEQEKQRLNAQLQAKINANTASQQKLTQVAQNTSGIGTAHAEGGKYDWMRQSGISEADFTYVDYIISKESGWNPNARNASSGAGGLPQALPYSKTGCAWGDPICQLRWADKYAKSRYGSWGNAYNFWLSKRWW